MTVWDTFFFFGCVFGFNKHVCFFEAQSAYLSKSETIWFNWFTGKTIATTTQA